MRERRLNTQYIGGRPHREGTPLPPEVQEELRRLAHNANVAITPTERREWSGRLRSYCDEVRTGTARSAGTAAPRANAPPAWSVYVSPHVEPGAAARRRRELAEAINDAIADDPQSARKLLTPAQKWARGIV